MGSLEDRWQRELDELRAAGRYRELRLPTGHDFTSNDYLGYAKLPSPEEPKLSTSGAASRLLRGHHVLWTMVENRLGGWHQAPAALIFTSGYVANEGLLGTIICQDDWVASDACNHASIIDGLRLSRAERFVYRHDDLDHLRSGLRGAGTRQKFIVTESLFSMDGDVAPLADLAALAAEFEAGLIVDEAHATGCFGSTGSGLVDALGLRSRVLATVHTGGKALGVPGAYVVSSTLIREILVNRCRHLLFTTALPPLVAGWWSGAIDRAYDDHAGRIRLHANAANFRKALERHGMTAEGADYLVPIVLGDDRRAVAAAARLQGAGFDVRAIRPPTVPVGTARLRISIHADHEASLLESLAAELARVLREVA